MKKGLMKGLRAIIAAGICALILPAAVSAVVFPTDEWVNVYGDGCLLNGKALPVGGVIDAFDPQGVHCGRIVVDSAAGFYRFMPVYRDDIRTPARDEGAIPGDALTLKINGVTTTQSLGPDVPVWTKKGDAFKVNLSAAQAIAFTLKIPAGTITSPGQSLLYLFKIVNTGSGIDLFDLSMTNSQGWAAEYQDGNPTAHVNPLDSVDVLVKLTVPSGITQTVVDTLSLTAASRMDNTVTHLGKVVTTVIVTAAGEENVSSLPDQFALSQNHPNPFNPRTTIDYSLKRSGQVRLEICNVLGQVVAVPVDGFQAAGDYSVSWNAGETGRSLPSGIYFYRLHLDGQTLTRKMVLMK